MSFSNGVKKEILNNNWKESDFLFFSFLKHSGCFKKNMYIFKTSLKEYKEIILDPFNFIEEEIEVIETKKYLKIEIHNEERIQTIKNNISSLKPNTKEKASAYIAGIFLSHGWISNLDSKNYHLELRLDSKKDLDITTHLFKFFGIETSFIKKNKYFYIYFKKSSRISDFLKIIKATNSLMDFENERIQRSFSSTMLKMDSIEKYNKNIIKKSSSYQIELINHIFNSSSKNKLTNNQINISNLRLEKPTVSLQDLTFEFNKKYKKNYSKSSINKWFKDMGKLVNE